MKYILTLAFTLLATVSHAKDSDNFHMMCYIPSHYATAVHCSVRGIGFTLKYRRSSIFENIDVEKGKLPDNIEPIITEARIRACEINSANCKFK